MQIKIYVKNDNLSELNHFLKTEYKYEHSIQYWTYRGEFLSFAVTEVMLFYDDFVALEDFSMENRTKEK